MNRTIQKCLWLLGAAAAAFLGGSALACTGNYCPTMITSQCIALDYSIEESCCKNLDATGLRCWTCSREVFACNDDFEDLYFGPGYNCHSPGAPCN